MNDKKYKWVLNIILVVILATICIQVYWNYKNYLVNKQQLINDVQVSLDNAVGTYYTDLAENTTYKFTFKGGEFNENMIVNGDTVYDRIFQDINTIQKDTILDSISVNGIEHVAIFQTLEKDTLLITDDNGIIATEEWVGDRKILKAIKSTELDSLSKKNFEMLTAKVMLRLSNDTINIKRISTLLEVELKRKNIAVNYNLLILSKFKEINKANLIIVNTSGLTVESKSSFLPHNSKLKMSFTDITKTIFKRIFTGILLSTLLVLAVIACLFYLLKIIKHQKQLSKIKNDFISNITHEFKTPISTISVALEGIKNFNAIDDKEKTKKYVQISSNQLEKLTVMVEKLLETAMLDVNQLLLKKEPVYISKFITSIIEKQQLITENKQINYISTDVDFRCKIDVFHFENVINNLIDNALKYGGEKISIDLSSKVNNIEIRIVDNGNTLIEEHKDKIFEQFYRVPTGNIHAVKGFGIGLYYVRKIIEMHNGSIQLELRKNQTIFKIILPYEK